jgi:hypothetical protein
MPEQARAAAPGVLVPVACAAIFTVCVFMDVFLFTVVNTQYGADRVLYPNFASGFAALFLPSSRKSTPKSTGSGKWFLLETKV